MRQVASQEVKFLHHGFGEARGGKGGVGPVFAEFGEGRVGGDVRGGKLGEAVVELEVVLLGVVDLVREEGVFVDGGVFGLVAAAGARGAWAAAAGAWAAGAWTAAGGAVEGWAAADGTTVELAGRPWARAIAVGGAAEDVEWW